MNDFKNKMMFFAPDGGGEHGGAGSAVFDEAIDAGPAKDEVAGGEPPTRTEPKVKPEGATEVDATPAAPAAAPFNVKEFAREFAGSIKESLPGKEEPKLTPEEAKKLLNVWDPTPEWITKFDNLETRNAAIQEMRDGLIRHADTIGQHRTREAMTAMEAKFAPVMEIVQRMETEARENRFDSTFPQLAKPTLRPLLHAVAQDFVNKGKKFDSEEEMFAALGGGMEAVIKETNSDFKLEKASGSTPAKTKTSVNAIPVTSPGSGGGTGKKGGGTGAEKPRGLAIFDK